MKEIKTLIKPILTIAVLFGVTGVAMAAGAAPKGGIADVAGNITSNLSGVAKLITGGSYVAGLGFAIGAILKFKAHKDNPTQIPVGTPIALVFISAALLFIPSIIKTTGGTLFGSSGGKSTGTEGFADLSDAQ